MDPKAFVTKGKSTLHVLHEVTNKPLYADSNPLTGERPKAKKGEELQGVPVTITGFGSDSNEYRAITSDQLRKYQASLVEQRNQKLDNFIPDPIPPEDVRDQVTELLSGIITEWTGFDSNFKCDAKNREWLIENADSIRNQWDKHVHKRENFLVGA